MYLARMYSKGGKVGHLLRSGYIGLAVLYVNDMSLAGCCMLTLVIFQGTSIMGIAQWGKQAC